MTNDSVVELAWQCTLLVVIAAASFTVVNEPALGARRFSVLRIVEIGRVALFTTFSLGLVGTLKLLDVPLPTDLLLAGGLAGLLVTTLSILWLGNSSLVRTRLRDERVNTAEVIGSRKDEAEKVSKDLQARISKRSSLTRWALSSFLVLSVLAGVIYLNNNRSLARMALTSSLAGELDPEAALSMEEMIGAANVIFFSTEPLTCAEDDTVCRTFSTQVDRLRSNRALFFWKTALLFVLFSTLFGYIARLAELKVAVEPDEEKELGLRHDVVEHAGGVYRPSSLGVSCSNGCGRGLWGPWCVRGLTGGRDLSSA